MAIKEVLDFLMQRTVINGRKANSRSLGMACGLPAATIHRIKKGTHGNAKDETVEKLATYFRVSKAQMRGEEPLPDIANLGNITQTTQPTRKVRLCYVSQAGSLSRADSESGEFVFVTYQASDRAYALIVEGDSMAGRFPAGTVVLVEPDIEPVPGYFVIAQFGENEPTFKQLVKDGGELYLKPLNPAYPTKLLGDAKILGVVVQSIAIEDLI